MAGYLDTYGVADERRGRIVKRLFISVLTIAVVSTSAYFYFRTWREEKTVKQFLSAIAKEDFQGAYKMFGCTQDTPCRYYPPEKFNEDWGPSTPHSNTSAAKIENVDYCDSGVVFNISYPKADPVWLWVDSSNETVSSAPWPRCPGRHWEFRKFFHSLFSS